MSFPPTAPLDFSSRLGDSWSDLADHLNIPYPDRRPWPPGEEPRRIWAYLADRSRLAELPAALTAVGRADLVDMVSVAAPDQPGRTPSPSHEDDMIAALNAPYSAVPPLVFLLIICVGVAVLNWPHDKQPDSGPTGAVPQKSTGVAASPSPGAFSSSAAPAGVQPSADPRPDPAVMLRIASPGPGEQVRYQHDVAVEVVSGEVGAGRSIWLLINFAKDRQRAVYRVFADVECLPETTRRYVCSAQFGDVTDNGVELQIRAALFASADTKVFTQSVREQGYPSTAPPAQSITESATVDVVRR